MNTFLKSQCKNMIVMVKTFEQACKMAVLQDVETFPVRKEKH